jgi:dUTP pyrophosphatase
MSEIVFFIADEIKALYPDWLTQPRNGDAGFDLRCRDEIILNASEQLIIPTGLFVNIPVGYVGLIKERSSRALEKLRLHGGVIDCSYRGEIKVIASNGSNSIMQFKESERIAQLIVIPCCTNSSLVSSIDNLGSTERGDQGFGSTGKL